MTKQESMQHLAGCPDRESCSTCASIKEKYKLFTCMVCKKTATRFCNMVIKPSFRNAGLEDGFKSGYYRFCLRPVCDEHNFEVKHEGFSSLDLHYQEEPESEDYCPVHAKQYEEIGANTVVDDARWRELAGLPSRFSAWRKPTVIVTQREALSDINQGDSK